MQAERNRQRDNKRINKSFHMFQKQKNSSSKKKINQQINKLSQTIAQSPVKETAQEKQTHPQS